MIRADDADREARTRPFGVALLTFLLLVYASLSVPFVLDVPGIAGAGVLRVVGHPEIETAAHAALAAVAVVAAAGLWLLRPWGWVAAMLLAGPTLAVELALYVRGDASLPYMGVATLIALYLHAAGVRRRYFPAPPPQGVGVPPERRRP
jgi:hypothetical protein